MSMMTSNAMEDDNARIIAPLDDRLGKSSVILIQEGAVIKTIPIVSETRPSALHDDVHITPSFMEFTEASEGIICRQRITVKNTGTKPAFVRIREPNSIAFQVKALKSGVMLNPGLSASSYVIYSFKRPSLLRAIIPIEINGKVLDYRVICTLATEGISIEPKSIDFGIIDIGYSSGLKIITINNDGGKSTRFSIDLGKNDLQITVKPLRGVVRPNKQVKLRVELIGMNEGLFFSEFWIKSVPNIRVPLKVHVIIPRLVIYHPNTTGDFTLIDFPPTLENTRRYDTFVLRNLSSQVSSYVVLGEIDNEVKCMKDIDRKKYPVFDAFEIKPIQGRMDPFEGLIFEVGFTPSSKLMQWRQRSKKKEQNSVKQRTDHESPENDFMAFVRIIRVHVTETEDILRIDPVKDLFEEVTQKSITHDTAIMDISSSSSSQSSSLNAGVADTMKLCFHGEVETARLNFQPDILYFGEIGVGEISQRVVRVSNSSRLASITSRYVRNASAHSYPETVTLKPKGSVEILVRVKGKENVTSPFNVFFDVIADSYDSTVHRRHVKVKIGSYPVQCFVKVILKPRQNPKSFAVCTAQNTMEKFVKMHKNLLPKPVYPEAFSAEEAFNKNHRLYWLTYLRKSGRKQLIKGVDDDNEIISNVIRTPKWRYKKISELVQCGVLKKDKSSVLNTKTEVLIPLSPLHIYNVHIFPSIFTFGMVASRSYNYKQLIIENKNEFPVMIRLISLWSECINFPEGNLIILSAGSIIKRLIEFHAGQIGKFNGYIDYVINDNHSFELSITADVVRKQLSLDTREIMIGSEYLNEELYQPMEAIIQIKNKLDAKTCFRWETPTASNFQIEPVYGAVRGNSNLYSYIYSMSHSDRANSTELTMKCESGTYINVQLNTFKSAVNVRFINDYIGLGEMPLNLPAKATAVILNSEFVEVAFEVDSSSLPRGCKVLPLKGVIPPRGIQIIEIQFIFKACLRFSTMIRVIVQRSRNLQIKVTGQVSFPRLKLFPTSIDARRISVDAYQCYQITASNVGTTTLKLNFLLEEYPEFRVSLSSNRIHPDIDSEETVIEPGCNKVFYLHFDPVDLATYIFYLPIVINDILGPAMLTNSKSINPSEYLLPHEQYYKSLPDFFLQETPEKIATISIDCIVKGHTVFFNKLLFHFDISTQRVEDELIIENRESNHEITLQIETDNFKSPNCPFSIRWSNRGIEPTVKPDLIEFTLQLKENTNFILDFRPEWHGNISLEAAIFLCTDVEKKMFNKLSLKGDNHGRSIKIENSEIYLPPVPLSTTIEEKVCLILANFESSAAILTNIEDPDCYCGNYKNAMLSVKFPNGNVVPATQFQELEVTVIFKSEESVSVRSTVEFRDDTGFAVCALRVFAIADNNLLTIHTYSMKPIDDFQSRKNIEHRISYISLGPSSDSEDDEDSDDVQQSFAGRRNSQGSAPRISVHSYFQRHSRGSLGKITESQCKQPGNEAMNIEDNVMEYDNTQGNTEVHFDPDKHDAVSSSLPKARKSSLKFVDSFHRLDEPKTDHEIYISKTIKVAEEWLYSVPFKFTFYPDIPNGITAAFSNFMTNKKTKKNVKRQKNLILGYSFVFVLECLTDSEIYDYVEKPEHLPENDIERIDYILNLYNKILYFLLNRGAHVAHILPQFLLSHNDYLLAVNYEQNHLLTISSLPRQCELHDKALQSVTELSKNRQKSPTQSTEEIFLLTWLQYHYDQEREKDWMIDRRTILNPNESNDVAYSRTIENFDDDLSDSLVLIAITAAYCPFLIEEYFNDCYICPRNYEETLHNAVCVVNAWRRIRLGFAISPLDIVRPHCLKMLMLVVHLFEILPTYIPRAKVKFSCSLTETVSRQISFTNPTEVSVGYLLLFVGNDSGSFTIANSQSILRLNGHDSTLVQIQFHARKIRKLRAYLLFCGSAIGPNFARNQTFILEGEADNLGITETYFIHSKVYQVIDKVVNIKAPYQNAAEYEIWMSEEPPSKPSMLKMTRWSEISRRKMPRRLFLNQKSITVTEDKREGHLSITVACIAPIDRYFWLIFQSKFGDFIVQINSKWQPALTDRLVVKWSDETGKCTCLPEENIINEMCPFNFTLSLPMRNEQLWSCVSYMFQKTLDSKERVFWSRYLDTYIGLRLIRWLMGSSSESVHLEFAHIFHPTVTYNVTTPNKMSPIVFPDSFTISDVRPPNENTPMTLHISPSTPELYETTLSLTSADGKELRVYVVNFLRE